ncbi:unnamed protein product [Somion occarium]|uniref:Uncharacterized protein n=1 Tax=Somion occarium TaxID=3059160 RepID=A0ABP1DY34_9APHY
MVNLKSTVTMPVVQVAAPAVLADALSNFSKAANIALAAVEDHARKQVDQANVGLEEARRERDEAIEELRAIQRREVDWESNAKSSGLTIKHQAESIARLTEEAQLWKNQLLRLEETFRREIQDWKEQYLRAEQERSRLSARIEELVSEQLLNRPHSSKDKLLEIIDPSSSTLKRSSTTSALALSQAPLDDTEIANVSRKSQPRSTKPANGILDNGVSHLHPRTPVSNAVASSSRTPKQRHATEPSSSTLYQDDLTPSRQSSTSRRSVVSSRVIRRVHAVVEVPIKEEDDADNTAYLSEGARSVGQVHNSNISTAPTTARRKSVTGTAANGRQTNSATTPKARRKSTSQPKGKQPARYTVDESSASEDNDEDEDDDGSEYEPLPVQSRSGLVAADDEDDDLLLGSQEQGAPPPPPQRSRAIGNTKKRKLDDAGGTSRGTAKVARKKH